MLLSGIGLSIAGFIADPLGEISDSVLWYVSQSLVYAGSIFGVTLYIRSRFAEISRELHPQPGDGNASRTGGTASGS